MHPEFPPIIIESLCRRLPGQNVIQMADGTTYDFRDDGSGKQVAIVANEAHAQRLLSITEGYRFAGAAIKPVESGGRGMIADVLIVTPATQTAEGQKAEPTGAADTQKADAPVNLPDEPALEAMELSALRAQFSAETGRNASPKHKADVLIAQILAARETAPQS